MAVKVEGSVASGSNIIAVDSLGNLGVDILAVPAIGAAGGYYTTTGQTPGVVAAALAADVMLMSMRMQAGSTRKAYVTKLALHISTATIGAGGGIAGVLGLRRFTAQTPTGGVARVAQRMNPNAGTASDITDIRDSNAALTGTAPTWGDPVKGFMIPLMSGAIAAGTLNNGYDYETEFTYPIVLSAGDGLALRTLQAMPATQTWVYSYTVFWFEK